MQPAHPLPSERRDDLQADLDLSIVIPCLNEVKTLPAVIARASRTIDRLGLRGEVLVSDNGSVDGRSRPPNCSERGCCTVPSAATETRCGTA